MSAGKSRLLMAGASSITVMAAVLAGMPASAGASASAGSSASAGASASTGSSASARLSQAAGQQATLPSRSGAIGQAPAIPSQPGYIPAGSTAGLTPVDGTTGLPLGGVGTGAVRFWPAKGTFMAQETTPTDMDGFAALAGAGFEAYTDRGGSVQTSSQLAAESADGRDADNAVYPLQTVNFGSLNDVAMSLDAFGPFDQQDVTQMTDPYAFFDIAVTNTQASAVRVAVAFQLGAGSGSVTSLAPGEGFSTTTAGIERAVYAAAGRGVSVSAGDNSGFLSSGSVAPAAGSSTNATAATVGLRPHQTAHLRFVYAWYNHTDPSQYYYSNNFSTAAGVAVHGLAEFSTLEKNAVTFAGQMSGSNIPSWYTSYVSNTLTLFPINSIYTADGRLTYAEGCCGNSGTMDQMWNGRQIISELFPSLAFQELEYWASTQQPNGQIHHDFANDKIGTAADIVPWGDWDHPDVYGPVGAVDAWVDLNAGFIIGFYETYIATGDKNMITQPLPHLPEGFWPHLQAAGQRILNQVAQYGDTSYPYTFDGTKCTFDSGGPCDMYNAGLSADAYEAMAKLATAEGDSALAATYQQAFQTVNTSFTERYLTGDFPAATGFHDSSELAGQWIAYFLQFGQLYPTANLDYGISQLDNEYQPLVNGVLNEPGEGTWTPYMITHYGGLLAETGDEAGYECLAQSMTQDAYLDRDYVFNQTIPMDPGSPPDQVIPATVTTGQRLDYISLPAIWRDYYVLTGYHRDASTGQLWIEPHLLPSMDHKLTDGVYFSPEGDGTISETQFGNAYQDQSITLRPDSPLYVSTLYVSDTSAGPATVRLDGRPVAATPTGTGYAEALAIPVNGQVGPGGLTVTVTYAGSGGAPATVTSAPVCVGANPALPRTGWTATASSSAGGSSPALAVDGDSATAWATAPGTGAPQWFELDLGTQATFDKISVTPGAEPANHLCACSVYVSSNGTTWGSPVATVWQAPLAQIEFPVQTARYVKIVDNESGDPTPWSIAEINLFHVGLPTGGWTATAASGQPGSALDGNPSTAWTTSRPQRPGDWFTVDMGSQQELSQVVLDTGTAASDYPASYALYLSADGTDWGSPVATGTGGAVTTISFPQQTARYLKVVETGSSARPWAIAEFSAYAPFTPSVPPVNSQGWTAVASTGTDPMLAIDGNLGTRWTTNAKQAAGDWFAVDLGKPTAVSQIVLNDSVDTGDYPRAYAVYVSADGANWGNPVATGTGTSAVTSVSFPQQTAQYIKVVLTQSVSTFTYWSVDEFQLQVLPLSCLTSGSDVCTSDSQGNVNNIYACVSGGAEENSLNVPVAQVVDSCGVRVWLHQYAYPAFTTNGGWAYCVSPGTDVDVPSEYDQPQNLQITANSAAC